MKNQSLIAPLLEQDEPKHTRASYTRNWFCACCAILGVIVGFLSQRNDLSVHLMTYIYQNVSNLPLLSALAATATTIQLMVFLCLLRGVVSHQELSERHINDMDRFFGMGGVAGVCVAWFGVPMWPCLLMTFLGVNLFRVLHDLCTREDKDEEDSTSVEEYTLAIV